MDAGLFFKNFNVKPPGTQMWVPGGVTIGHLGPTVYGLVLAVLQVGLSSGTQPFFAYTGFAPDPALGAGGENAQFGKPELLFPSPQVLVTCGEAGACFSFASAKEVHATRAAAVQKERIVECDIFHPFASYGGTTPRRGLLL